MYCTSCGTNITDKFRYCPQCGTATENAVGAVIARPLRLSRSRDDRKIAGVCAGIARYLGIDVTLVRVLMIVFTIWPPGVGLILYLVCWIVIPNDPLLLPPPDEAGAVQRTVA